MARWRRQLKRWTAGILDVPQDVIFDMPRITMIGNLQMVVENHRGVIHFSDHLLKLSLTKGTLEVTGNGLVIRAILPEEVFIEGTIHNVKYV